MSKKSFTAAPQPKTLSPAEITRYVEKGPGKDNGATDTEMRLAFLLPKRLHNRFKSACAARGLKMAEEIRALVERRTEELER
jgi:hypothetical protein